MNESQISVRYAKALFSLAEEKQKLEEIHGDMELLAQTCQVDEFKYMLVLPSLQVSQKRSIVEAVLKPLINEHSMSMINLVIKNKREIYLPAIARNFRDLYRKAMDIRSASLVTAAEIGKDVIEKIKQLVVKAYQSEIDLTASVDDALIGGFILTVDDRRYDASVSGSLRKMKNKLITSRIENT